MNTYTNIIEYKIDKDLINKDFIVVHFKNEKDFKKVNSKLLDNPDINIRAFSYSSGTNAYALLDKDAFDDLRYCEELKEGNIAYQEMNIDNVFDYMLIKLFMNSLSNYQNDEAYNNLTGKFYKFITNCGRKIKALDFNVYEEKKSGLTLLNVSSTSFKKVNKFPSGDPAYLLSGNCKTLKRTFDVKEKDIYVKGNDKDHKTSHPFLVIEDGSGRAKELNELVALFNRKNGKYISISLKAYEIKSKISAKNNKLQDDTMDLIKKHKINIVNKITDLLHEDKVVNFVDGLKKQGLKVSLSDTLKKDKLNLVIIYDKDYYEKNKIADPHKTLESNCVNQCITIDNLDQMLKEDDVTPSPQLITVYKELLIKDDIINNINSFSYDNWKEYNFAGTYKFLVKDDEDVLFRMTINPDGKYFIEEVLIDLFNSYENDEKIQFLKNNKSVQMIIEDDKGNINAIERTDIITLPHPELFRKGRISKSKDNKDNLYSGLCDINYYEIDNFNYYNAGLTLKNIKMKIYRASHLYRIICLENSKCIMTNILELMSVGFVRYNELTVLPYPIKYLREYINIYKK